MERIVNYGPGNEIFKMILCMENDAASQKPPLSPQVLLFQPVKHTTLARQGALAMDKIENTPVEKMIQPKGGGGFRKTGGKLLKKVGIRYVGMTIHLNIESHVLCMQS